MPWKKQSYPAGTLCRVMLLDDTETTGTLKHDFTLGDKCNLIPTLVLKDGREVRGFECWWIPVEECEDQI